MASSTLTTTMTPSTLTTLTHSIPIPRKFEWIHVTSTRVMDPELAQRLWPFLATSEKEQATSEKEETMNMKYARYASATSTTTTAPFTSTTMTPSIPIPRKFEWIHVTSTRAEREKFLWWVRFAADEMEDDDEGDRLIMWADSILTNIACFSDPESDRRFLDWVHSASTMVVPAEPNRLLKWAHGKAAPDKSKRFSKWVHSKSTMAAPAESKRLLKWAHHTARIAAPDRWSLREEILKPFEIALEDGYPSDIYPDLKKKHRIYAYKGKHGVYECQDALWIWPGLLNCRGITVSELDRGPRYVGEKIKKKFPKSDMIKGRPSVNKLGFVTIELSGKWIAKRIHKMLKAGIDTWAPKLPVQMVIVDYPSLDEEMHVDLFQRSSIGCMLMSILEFSKVDVTIGDRPILPTCCEGDGTLAQEILNRCFLYEERGGDVVMKGKVPFILPKTNFNNAYKDVLALRYGQEIADWIVYVTPVQRQDYMEMCFTAAKLEKCIPSPTTSYAGYRTTLLDDSLLDKVRTRCLAVEQGEAAKLLGYTAEAVLDCVFRYTCLTNHRLAVWRFDIDDMLNEEGNTFVYLLNTQAKVRRITDDYCKDINELKKASELILEKDEGWEKGEERMLGFHLLEFTEALEDSCLSVLPHILCEYLHSLSKKFNRYYSSVFKVETVVDTNTLLLCEATAVVMEKCFHLLGITPASFFALSMTQLPLRLPLSASERQMDVKARDPPRSSRFELFSFRTTPVTHFRYDKEGKLFGLISISDKYGLLSDAGSNFFQPDFAHVPLFNHAWYNPINMIDDELVYLGNPSSHHSVPICSSIEIRMELYVTKKKNACYHLCNHKIEIDLSAFWDKKSDGECGHLSVVGEDLSTNMYYMVLKDAVDATLEVKFETNTRGREVSGYVLAYYGDDFLYECQSEDIAKDDYTALLFLADRQVLKPGKIQLIKSMLAVPTKGSLVIKAYLEDARDGQVIMKKSYIFKPQHGGCSYGTLSGWEDCSLHLKVDWQYQAQ